MLVGKLHGQEPWLRGTGSVLATRQRRSEVQLPAQVAYLSDGDGRCVIAPAVTNAGRHVRNLLARRVNSFDVTPSSGTSRRPGPRLNGPATSGPGRPSIPRRSSSLPGSPPTGRRSRRWSSCSTCSSQHDVLARLETLDRVAGIDGGKPQLDDHTGEEVIDADGVTLEPRLEDLDALIRHLHSRDAPKILDGLRKRRAPFSTANRRYPLARANRRC